LWHDVVGEARFYGLLTKIDEELAAVARTKGCECGGSLHVARYPRKPRGAGIELGPEYEWRWSFCCAREGCRKRCTPPSVRYFGRRVYLGCVFVLVSALMNGPSPGRVARLHGELGVGLRTLRRWRKWWQHELARTALWRGASGRFSPSLEERLLPGAMLDRFCGEVHERVLGLLTFLSPLTTTSA
jgi:hypothetical protein